MGRRSQGAVELGSIKQGRKVRGREHTGSKVFQEVCFFGEVAQVQEPHGGKQDDS